MGKVRMRSMRDGQVYEFDSGPNNKFLREAIDSGDWQQELSTGQHVAKFVGDMAPPALSMLGATAGVGGGTIGGAGVASIPAAVGGGFAGGAGGGMMGQALKENIYRGAGIVTDDRPAQMAGRMAYEGATGGLGGMLGGLAQPAHPKVAQSLMERSLNAVAEPHVEGTMRQFGITADRAGINRADRLIGQLRAEKDALISWADQNAPRFSWKNFRELIAGATQRAGAEDILSVRGEQAMARVMRILGYKADRIAAASGRAADAASGEPQLGMQELERIRARADRMVTYYQQRALGQNPGPPSPLEDAYAAVANMARQTLNRLSSPVNGRTLEQINDEISRLVDAKGAVTRSVANPQRGRDIASATIGAATTGGAALWSHDPARAALLALPGAAAGYATSNPSLLSRTAIALNNPSVARGIAAQSIPQSLGLIGNMMGMADPTARAGAFGTAKPDGSQ